MEKEVQKIEVRDIRDGDWYWIPRKIFEDYAPKMGVIGLALYNAYASYARDKGVAFPSQKIISEKLGISIKTIIKYNKILQENGLIKIEKGKGRGKTNLVTLLKVENVKEGKLGTEPSSVEMVKQVQIERKEMKENKEREIDGSIISEVFRYFREVVGNSKGFIPEIDFTKDGKLVKARLENHSLEEIKDLIDWYLKSELSDRLGVSLSACLSVHVMNLWKADKNQSLALEKFYPSWQLKE
ncbi:MAG: helix-turn-helix domain-containing protein [Nitrososphaerota archaeon]